MNRNSKRAAKERSREVADLHRQGRKVDNPPSQRKSRWRGNQSRAALVRDTIGRI
jgi:hypothetical protein